MALNEYSRKRKFKDTPEPPPELSASQSGRVFCVQRHDATRLHYDLRIEVNGTLKSWAVPNGPTLDPVVKQLAVHVEDHPLEYATFEGNIPKGNYGAGSMMLWDLGQWEQLGTGDAEAQLARGDFKFRLNGEKLRGEFALVRMKDRKTGGESNDWLLLKKKDEHATSPYDVDVHAWSVKTGRTQQEIALEVRPAPEAAMPSVIEPMLAQLSDELPSGDPWVFEIKWDGVRAMLRVDNGTVRATGRKGNDISATYPEVCNLASRVHARSAILDGEIVVLDDNGRPSFERIQPRIMAAGENAIARLAKSRPAIFYAFDLLYLDGRDLRGLPLSLRKERLRSVVAPAAHLRLSEHFAGNGPELLAAARAQNLEGVVAKRLDSFYESSRSTCWVKVKVTQEHEFVICGYTKGEREYFGSLLLGVWDQGQLRFAGAVGTGFDQKLMKQIWDRMQPLIAKQSPLASIPRLPQEVAAWTKPELVATVRYLEWTEEGRLRAPVFVGLREDVEPAECVRIAPQATPSATPKPDLIPAGKSEVILAVEGHRLAIRNLNKVFFPAQGYTKRDLLNYYDAVADLLVPHWKDRPLSLRRYPDGIHGESFFQKNAEQLPDWIRTTELEEGDEQKLRVVGDGRAELLYLTQLGCIDQNPWMSRVGSLDHPDFLLIDLDPQETGYDRIVEAANYLRRKLDAIGLTGYPKTTGGDGMHIYVPLEPVYSYEQTKAVCEVLARIAAAERPDLFTTPRSVARRERDRVYFDHLQNGRGKTISAPYVVRAHDGAPVATPLDWSEVKPGLRPQQFDIRNAIDRFRRVGDLFGGVLQSPQRLEPAIERLAGLLAGAKRK